VAAARLEPSPTPTAYEVVFPRHPGRSGVRTPGWCIFSMSSDRSAPSWIHTSTDRASSSREVTWNRVWPALGNEGAASAAPAASADIAQQDPPRHTADRWLTIIEAARHLGYPCASAKAPNSVYELAEAIGHKVNGRWLISLQELDAWVRRAR
jgi:hypothetical protein